MEGSGLIYSSMARIMLLEEWMGWLYPFRYTPRAEHDGRAKGCRAAGEQQSGHLGWVGSGMSELLWPWDRTKPWVIRHP